MSTLEIGPMGPDELALAVEWAAAEGWNPGLGDVLPFLAADPGGFLMGRLHGEPVGCISAVRYGGDFGFLGLYIVTPARRGQGLGRQLWSAGMQRLRGCSAVGLDGVEAQQGYYARQGFRRAHGNARYRGRGPAAGPGNGGALHCVPWDRVEQSRLLAFDREHFPAARPAFLNAWCSRAGVRAWVALSGGTVSGFGVIRPCREGWKVGPLFAADLDAAALLLGRLRQHLAPAEAFCIDVPECNGPALDWVSAAGFERVFATTRMYLGETPALPLECIFGISSLELG